MVESDAASETALGQETQLGNGELVELRKTVVLCQSASGKQPRKRAVEGSAAYLFGDKLHLRTVALLLLLLETRIAQKTTPTMGRKGEGKGKEGNVCSPPEKWREARLQRCNAVTKARVTDKSSRAYRRGIFLGNETAYAIGNCTSKQKQWD